MGRSARGEASRSERSLERSGEPRWVPVVGGTQPAQPDAPREAAL